jgi:ATP-binding cassette, subfamily B, multidrug efflux pump
MFKYLQSRIRGTASTGPGAPPPGLIAFYWHFVRQTKVWYAAMFATSLAVALIDTVILVFIGKPHSRRPMCRLRAAASPIRNW